MQAFIHHKVQALDNLICSYNDVQQLYIERDFGFDDRFKALLDSCLTFCRSQGTSSQVSEILNVLSMFETASRGIDPFRLERVRTGRRELKMMVAYHGLEKLHQELILIHDKEFQKLKEAEQILSDLLLKLYQAGVLDDSAIQELNSVASIGVFWRQLLNQNGSIAAVDKQLRMKLIPEDIFLTIERILSKLR